MPTGGDIRENERRLGWRGDYLAALGFGCPAVAGFDQGCSHTETRRPSEVLAIAAHTHTQNQQRPASSSSAASMWVDASQDTCATSAVAHMAACACWPCQAGRCAQHAYGLIGQLCYAALLGTPDSSSLPVMHFGRRRQGEESTHHADSMLSWRAPGRFFFLAWSACAEAVGRGALWATAREQANPPSLTAQPTAERFGC
jgi:hypothetical protein